MTQLTPIARIPMLWWEVVHDRLPVRTDRRLRRRRAGRWSLSPASPPPPALYVLDADEVVEQLRGAG
jgi:hypothetical protein